jgi:NADH:ubiquinone oxidoreductase subunit 3 (subunit A)
VVLETIVLPLELFSLKKSGSSFMEFAPIFIYLVISLLLSLILIGVSFLFASSSGLAYPEKLSAYECGFEGGR